jgi:hypothetical protein
MTIEVKEAPTRLQGEESTIIWNIEDKSCAVHGRDTEWTHYLSNQGSDEAKQL